CIAASARKDCKSKRCKIYVEAPPGIVAAEQEVADRQESSKNQRQPRPECIRSGRIPRPSPAAWNRPDTVGQAGAQPVGAEAPLETYSGPKPIQGCLHIMKPSRATPPSHPQLKGPHSMATLPLDRRAALKRFAATGLAAPFVFRQHAH